MLVYKISIVCLQTKWNQRASFCLSIRDGIRLKTLLRRCIALDGFADSNDLKPGCSTHLMYRRQCNCLKDIILTHPPRIACTIWVKSDLCREGSLAEWDWKSLHSRFNPFGPTNQTYPILPSCGILKDGHRLIGPQRRYKSRPWPSSPQPILWIWSLHRWHQCSAPSCAWHHLHWRRHLRCRPPHPQASCLLSALPSSFSTRPPPLSCKPPSPYLQQPGDVRPPRP
mmetsp:Transcript_8511/g.19056  ORF Transcript_8511/g.19056 Transcript_8511/m.19056 type:complete len:226 (-) Transcript_8511:897-1574(-)